MQVAVVGGGSWGTALANLVAGKGIATVMLVRDQEQAREINEQHTNSRYLDQLPLCSALCATVDPQAALAGASICLLVVPCKHMRDSLQKLAPFIAQDAIVVCASKGIEIHSLCRMAEVVAQTLPGREYAILSGPSFAAEVIAAKPTAVALGCTNPEVATDLRELFSTALFRVYSSADVPGVELGGALKNIVAIAAGICDGLELGDNARAGLITRGLAEISRLGVAMGARARTFMGLSGLGDLVLTCTGNLSRNRQVGMRLAKGESHAQILASMHMVAEGVSTTEAVYALSRKLNVDMPIANAMYRILYEDALPAQVVEELMTRALREEG